MELPLPPLNEQKRIVARLDELLARVAACRARLERVPVLLQRLRQAILAAATSGQLTQDWRDSDEGWRTCLLGSLRWSEKCDTSVAFLSTSFFFLPSTSQPTGLS